MKRQSKISPVVTMFLAGIGSYIAIGVSVLYAAADPSPTIVIRPSTTVTNDSGETLTGTATYTITATNTNVTGGVIPLVNNVAQAEDTSPTSVDVTLTEGRNVVALQYTYQYTPDGATNAVKKSISSNAIVIDLDTTGPKLQHAEVVEVPALGTTLLVTFAEGDFQTATIDKGAFVVGRKNAAGNFTSDAGYTAQSVIKRGRTLRLPYSVLPAGEYQLTVLGDGKLTDKVGNRAGGTGDNGNDQKWLFSVLPERKYGQHVEFTPFAPPLKQEIPEEGFNPGDYVETRVARLYYFRDAHRVAQIINRNIRSYNQAAVTQAERTAEESRDDADSKTDERREKERAAVRAAEQARNAEQQLAQAQQSLAEAQDITRDMAGDKAENTRLGAEPPTDEKEKERWQKRKDELALRKDENTANLDFLGKPEDLAKQVTAMQQSVANLRQAELTAKDAWDAAEAKEGRARAKQFRDEVTAAETDPDTYVAGDMFSVDPVTQCSLSVIGEGLIQIRGPIKGINTIRTMINQIDSPVGQIKIGIFSVQVNGEEGDKMEKVVGDAEGFIDLSRFLVNQSLNMLRRSVQTEAALIAEQCELNGHYQVDRDRRYLYAFFGRDFIDELYEMNSEFLFTENKLLSLHSMDTLSFNRAMFMLALAKNDVRERIVDRFLEMSKTELPDAEFDFRRSSELKPHRTQKRFPPWNLTHLPVTNHYKKEQKIHEAVHRNALQRYHFRNFAGFFNTGFTSPDTMNPMQREFIRLAQIFKARLVAEMEWKQRVLERGLIEDRSNDEDEIYKVLSSVRDKAYIQLRDAYDAVLAAREKLASANAVLGVIDAELARIPQRAALQKEQQDISDIINTIATERTNAMAANPQLQTSEDFFEAWYKSDPRIKKLETRLTSLANAGWLSTTDKQAVSDALQALSDRRTEKRVPAFVTGLSPLYVMISNRKEAWESVLASMRGFGSDVRKGDATIADLDLSYDSLKRSLDPVLDTDRGPKISDLSTDLYMSKKNFLATSDTVEFVKDFLTETRAPLDHRKLLNHLIDQQEEKFIELVEGTRSHIAVMDQYLKRLSIALEDDFKVQFYDPAFVRVREAARGEPVNLSQVERTTILTNNRDFAKVDPQATMEFDLPKRQIAIKEAFDAAKALVEDSGALMKDPTFLSAFQMMGGSQQPSTVKNLIPSQSMNTNQQSMGMVPPPQEQGSPGSALQSLVPEPSIYKLETGTGFEIRPVMQPDGDSCVYDFNYMYTTNIREPVRADEKHVGRIKRHFVNTSVQTGNFELREISRYQVALKVSRTGQGVPLLQDIPVMGALFRPAPSAESSLQQNVIFGQTNLYPTLFDLMGLRWAQQVVDLNHTSVLETEHVIRGRQKSMRDFVFGYASERVDEFLDLNGYDARRGANTYRPDFYHEQTYSSPYHPNGYRYPMGVPDPTQNNFERHDPRPPEMQEPPYDRFRHAPMHPERIPPLDSPQRIPAMDAPMDHHYGESKLNPQQFHQARRPEFGALLLQGPSDSLRNGMRARLNGNTSETDRDGVQSPDVPGEDSLRPVTVDENGGLGSVSQPPALLKLRSTGLIEDRVPAAARSSAVLPASFERIDSNSKSKILRLPPVQ